MARNRRHKLVGKIGRNLGYYWQGFDNQDYDVATNGEEFVVRSLGRTKPRSLVFDVGAHTGEWGKMAATALPEGTIHSFEVIPATFAKLHQACAGRPNLTLHNLGLGDQEGELEFAVVKDHDELTSGVAGVHGNLHKFEFSKMRCPVTTGDRFCAQHNIEHVDLLKIDVEGMEPLVLKGFAGMLEQRRIGAVQFEYGQVNLQARFFLGDFHALLGRYDMAIGKVYPNYVDFCDYHFTQDTLMGPNFLAVSRANQQLIRILQG